MKLFNGISRRVRIVILILLVWPFSGALLPTYIFSGVPVQLIKYFERNDKNFEAYERSQRERLLNQEKAMAIIYLHVKSKYKDPKVIFMDSDPSHCNLQEEKWLIYDFVKIECSVNGVAQAFYSTPIDFSLSSYPSSIYVLLKNRRAN